MKRNCGRRWVSIICFGIIVVTAGCTRSIPANYNADMTGVNHASALEKVSLGVALFEDKRGWVDASDSQSESYIARQGFWKFGLTFLDKDYTPVKDVMQSVLIKEFKNAGINTKSISQVISKQNINKVWELSAKDKYDYVLGGQILAFEFVNDTGWTISSRRSVTLNLIMAKIDGQKVLLDTTYAETQSENEGMGVMHTTNIDKLMNVVVKKVVKQVVQEVATKMALNYDDFSLKVVFNGRPYDYGTDRM